MFWTQLNPFEPQKPHFQGPKKQRGSSKSSTKIFSMGPFPWMRKLCGIVSSSNGWGHKWPDMSLCCRDTSERKNRQFFVSTTTITTTLSTQSICFSQSNTLSMMLLCTFTRKKRTLDWEIFDKKNLGIDASPSLKEGKLSVAQEELDLAEKEVRNF